MMNKPRRLMGKEMDTRCEQSQQEEDSLNQRILEFQLQDCACNKPCVLQLLYSTHPCEFHGYMLLCVFVFYFLSPIQILPEQDSVLSPRYVVASFLENICGSYVWMHNSHLLLDCICPQLFYTNLLHTYCHSLLFHSCMQNVTVKQMTAVDLT